MLARIVVMSSVPRAATTSSSAFMTIVLCHNDFGVYSLPMYSATSRAYLGSIASSIMPIEKVLSGCFSIFRCNGACKGRIKPSAEEEGLSAHQSQGVFRHRQ